MDGREVAVVPHLMDLLENCFFGFQGKYSPGWCSPDVFHTMWLQEIPEEALATGCCWPCTQQELGSEEAAKENLVLRSPVRCKSQNPKKNSFPPPVMPLQCPLLTKFDTPTGKGKSVRTLCMFSEQAIKGAFGTQGQQIENCHRMTHSFSYSESFVILR